MPETKGLFTHLGEVRDAYPLFAFWVPSLPRAETIFNGLETVVNKAENAPYITFTRSKTDFLKSIPGFDQSQYRFLEYSYTTTETTEESIFSLSTHTQHLEIGKIKHNGRVTYQIKQDEKPTAHFTPQEIAKTEFADHVILLERIEAGLRKEIPLYFRPGPYIYNPTAPIEKPKNPFYELILKAVRFIRRK